CPEVSCNSRERFLSCGGRRAAFLALSAIAIIFRIYLIGGVIEGMQRVPVVGKRVPWDQTGVRRMEDLLFEVFRERPQQFAIIFAYNPRQCSRHGRLACRSDSEFCSGVSPSNDA